MFVLRDSNNNNNNNNNNNDDDDDYLYYTILYCYSSTILVPGGYNATYNTLYINKHCVAHALLFSSLFHSSPLLIQLALG